LFQSKGKLCNNDIKDLELNQKKKERKKKEKKGSNTIMFCAIKRRKLETIFFPKKVTNKGLLKTNLV
jgi:hypothetical protein